MSRIFTALRVEAPWLTQTLAETCQIFDATAGVSSLPLPVASAIQVLVTSGSVGASRQEIAMLPSLRLICTLGAGYEKVDIEAAAERGVIVVNSAGTNAAAVAEYAIGLLIAVVRDLRGYDRSARTGRWRGALAPRPSLAGKKIGIAGLGNIGVRIGKIAEAMELDVLYFSRAPKNIAGWRYMPTMMDLAYDADFLMLALPGGQETFHIVNSNVLRALGPSGYIVNVGRGSAIDSEALIEAIRRKEIAGAALDVFETEPQLPEALVHLPNVLLTPHVAGMTPEAHTKAAELICLNIKGVFDGSGPVSPVPNRSPDDPACEG